MSSDRYTRINGGLLQSHVNQKVCLMGQFMSIDKLNRMIKLRLTDDVVIMAAFETALTRTFEHEQWMQINGVLENRNKLKGEIVDAFKPEMTEKFDKDLYNEMIACTFENKTDYHITDNELETHFGTNDPGKDGENIQAIKIDTVATGDEPLGEMNFDIENSFGGEFDEGAGF